MAIIKSRRFADIYFVNGTVRHREEGDKEDTVFPIMEMIKIPLEGVKLYGEVFLRMTQLPPCSINLYMWLIMEAPKSMVVSTDEFQRNRFRSFSKKLGKEYKDHTVKVGFGDLVNLGLLIQMGRSRCKINPEFCFYGSEIDRRKEMKEWKRDTTNNEEYFINRKGKVEKKGDMITNI